MVYYIIPQYLLTETTKNIYNSYLQVKVEIIPCSIDKAETEDPKLI